MPKKIDADLLNAALLGLNLKRQTVDQRIAEIRRLLSDRLPRSAPRSKVRLRAASSSSTRPTRKQAAAQKTNRKASPPPQQKQEDGNVEQTPVAPAFENRAGRYELIRIEADQVYYSFTNRHGKTVDAVMPLIMWQRIQDRASQEDGRGIDPQP